MTPDESSERVFREEYHERFCHNDKPFNGCACERSDLCSGYFAVMWHPWHAYQAALAHAEPRIKQAREEGIAKGREMDRRWWGVELSKLCVDEEPREIEVELPDGSCEALCDYLQTRFEALRKAVEELK